MRDRIIDLANELAERDAMTVDGALEQYRLQDGPIPSLDAQAWVSVAFLASRLRADQRMLASSRVQPEHPSCG